MTTRRSIRKHQERRGAAVVEMAFVLPVFVSVTLGIVEFGRAMMVGQLVTNAAREGARLAVVDGSTNASVQDAITSFLHQSAGTSTSDVTVNITITPATGNANPGNSIASAHSKDLIMVQVSVPFNKVSFIKGKYLDGKNLTGQSAMRHE